MAKRRKPAKNNFRRRQPSREPYHRVLITCVGKSERIYFQEMRAELGLSRGNVSVESDAEGQDPMSMVGTTLQLQETEQRLGDGFDTAWIIFDRDRFDQFEPAIRRAEQLEIKPAWSVPCFEYWLLIHFEQTDRPFRGAGGLTGAQRCERRLRQHLPDGYEKGQSGAFAATWPHVDQAVRFARQRLNDPAWEDEKNPSTNVHVLVDYLCKLKQAQ